MRRRLRKKKPSADRDSSSFEIETPDFFRHSLSSESFSSPKFTDFAEHNIWLETQLNIFHSDWTRDVNIRNQSPVINSKFLEDVRVYVDVKLKAVHVLRRMLRDMGATVCLRFVIKKILFNV
ncbi:unnamed protein product [Thelazia callipaeda]|uniref:PRELI/MSF1 domain-containing protein n=1 Tax=Thelazia callipaeda TaxID=103827 RepID=A0A0N5CVM6_THECL|nr:unnamed protein product [Thelazia callipaeda]